MKSPVEMAFTGNPKLYKRQAVILSAASHIVIYLIFVVTKFVAQSENWFGVWQLPAGLAVSAVITGYFHYKWAMRLDAQYGRGSGWELREVTVKLPFLRTRKK